MNEETDQPQWRSSETWPYTDLDLTRIARTLGRQCLSESAVDSLTDAGMAYSLTIISDRNHGEKQRRKQFGEIARLAGKLSKRLRQLNAMSAQQLRVASPDDLELLVLSAEGAICRLRSRGGNPRSARREFIGDLYDIYMAETGDVPTRSKKSEEGVKTLFERFVTMALRPINPSATEDLRDDIKPVVKARRNAE